ACLLTLAISCTPSKREENTTEKQPKEYHLIKTPEAWVKKRVEGARSRVSGSKAGQIIWQSIEAHGGLEKWFSNGPLAFRFDYQPLDGGTRRDSYQVVDQWSVRAIHEVAANREMKYGWDGKNAWWYPDTARVGVNPRFWSTTPFYFVALPFVLADEGVVLEMLEPKTYKGVTYDLVKATYKEGVGDAPDDFYVMYIHPETKLIGALRYIVSYPGFFPEGGHSPEKFMEITGTQTINEMTLPTGYGTYWFKNEAPAEHITNIDVTDVSFRPELEKGYFEMPQGAKIQDDLALE
ncbi:MAG: DUF6503 family protein, partial [Bacteroidota bacterium]